MAMKRILIALLMTSLLVFAMGFADGVRHRLHSLAFTNGKPKVEYSWSSNAYSAGQRLELFHTHSLTEPWHLIHTQVVRDGETNVSYTYTDSRGSASSGFFTVRPYFDSDGDGYSDAQEELEFRSNPYSLDSDFDTIPDAEEIARGMNPADPDSDHDGVTDEFEMIYGTNPLSPDTDGDGICDFDERHLYFTNPLESDSDHDGLDDLFELQIGYDPNEEFSVNDNYSDRVMYLLKGTDPFEKKEGSEEYAWERVFYTGDPNLPIEYPTADPNHALLTLKVSGSGCGIININGRYLVVFADCDSYHQSFISLRKVYSTSVATASGKELAMSIPKGQEETVYFEIPPNMNIELSSDEFMIGEMKDYGYYKEGWIAFPRTDASAPCVHLNDRRTRYSSFNPGDGITGLTCEWIGTDKVNVCSEGPFAVSMWGDLSKGNVEKVRYRLAHEKYICGKCEYAQPVKYCYPETEEEEDSEDNGASEYEQWDYDWEDPVSPYDDSCDYEALSKYPRMENVLKLHNPREAVPIELKIEASANCCACEEHCSNYVEAVTVDQRLEVKDASGAIFTRTTENCQVLVSGIYPSQSVGDAKLLFNRNGKAYLGGDYTVLGVRIENSEFPEDLVRRYNLNKNLPLGVDPSYRDCTTGSSLTQRPNGRMLKLETEVGLSRGRVRLSLKDCTGRFQLWRRIVTKDAMYWECLLDSESMPFMSLNIGDWKQLIADGSVVVTALSSGTGKLTLSYGCLYNEKLIGDLAHVNLVAIDPRMSFDYDRDGVIDDADFERAADDKTVFRMWVNDDGDAESVEEGLVDLPGAGMNCADSRINGKRDLVDFTPLCVDLTDVKERSEDCSLCRNLCWRLTSSCVKAVPSALSWKDAGCFQTVEPGPVFGADLQTDLLSAAVEPVDAGYELRPGFVERAGDAESKGVLLLEGCEQGSGICLEGWLPYGDGGVTLVRRELKLEVMDVESMYDQVSLRDSASTVRSSSVDADDSENFVFVHGFNVNEQEARAWASEMYKRLWQAGLDARFTAVTWSGDSSQFHSLIKDDNYAPDYYVNVRKAFEAAARLPSALNGLPGKKVMLGHSLGNMLISSAASDYGLVYDRYYMLNAAVPMEAYDASAYAGEMVDTEWRKVPERYWAANWSTLFDEGDFRSRLSWRGRFSWLHDVINCYSETEDVLANPKSGQLTYIGGAWKIQELSKGTTTWYDLNALSLGDLDVVCEGGWGINGSYAINPLWYVYQYGFTDKVSSEFTRQRAIEQPLFTSFKAETVRMHSTDDMLVSSVQDRDGLRARFLGDAIPATSFAQGANYAKQLRIEANWSMPGLADNLSSWPRGSGGTCQWLHSDIKNLPYLHVHRLFEKIVKGN